MSFYFGASDEARTRYLHLGKVALYQMSYTRRNKWDSTKKAPVCQEGIADFSPAGQRSEKIPRGFLD